MGSDILNIVEKLLSLPRLEPGPVGQVAGIALTRIDEGDLPFTTYRGYAEPPSAVAGLELRCPGPGSKMLDGILILTLNPDLDVAAEAVRARFGLEESFDPRPAEAPEGAPSHTTYRLEGARLSFGFVELTTGKHGNWPSRLARVIIDRTGC